MFALDLRNHGSSPHADDMSYETMMDDVLGWMDARDVKRTTLLGHSMGGKVAMLLACRRRVVFTRHFCPESAGPINGRFGKTVIPGS